MQKGIKLENGVYKRCLATAEDYYNLLRRRKEIEEEVIFAGRCPSDGMPHNSSGGDETAQKAERLIARKRRLDEQIKAIEQAWNAARDNTEKDFIRLNLFEYVPMSSIKLPMSPRTMKRCRQRFLINLAANLFEI
ncbi:hypothetical protein [Clostridium sp. D33t1_170424_F3]|uniref:hypothetical protein n=1 Tax=Clostridium sp. D33t1_170424_F3 TaxID=2787099 RepID=UPI0018A98663|nr:hypothetical protein [Clostridium sp. D33t1_170424_F3]